MVAYGTIYNRLTRAVLGRHAFNMIVAREEGRTDLYCYEPMNDLYVKVQKGEDIVVGPWIYKPDWILAF